MMETVNPNKKNTKNTKWITIKNNEPDYNKKSDAEAEEQNEGKEKKPKTRASNHFLSIISGTKTEEGNKGKHIRKAKLAEPKQNWNNKATKKHCEKTDINNKHFFFPSFFPSFPETQPKRRVSLFQRPWRLDIMVFNQVVIYPIRQG